MVNVVFLEEEDPIITKTLKTESYEIWTDVNGLYASDPRKMTDIKINYEVAAMGGKVIHPYCILSCANKNIPIYIKNTFNQSASPEMTLITNDVCDEINAITIQDNIVFLVFLKN